MIDDKGFRANVGIVLCNAEGKLFWGRRIGQSAWQFPQGGVVAGESIEQALFRELEEEVGLVEADVRILSSIPKWLYYRLPEQLVRHGADPVCIGQKQRWFLLELQGNDCKICLNKSKTPEFDGWRWVDYWHPLEEVIAFKKQIYQQVLQDFLPKIPCKA